MKQHFILARIWMVLLMSAPAALRADVVVVVGQPRQAGATYLIKQDFEGAGYDNSESWTEASNPDEDDTTSPSPLVGSQSLRFNGTTQRAVSPSFTGQDTVYAYLILEIVSLGSLGGDLFSFVGPGVTVDINSSGMRIGGNVNSPRTTDGLSPGRYYVRLRYTRDLDGGGGSAVYSAEFSTTDSFTGSGNKYVEAVTGTDSAQCTAIQIRGETGGTAVEWIVDKVRADDAVINGNPP